MLFATNEGLYLRILERENKVPNEEKSATQGVGKSMWSVEPEFLTELCDLKIEGSRIIPRLNESDEKSESLDFKNELKKLEELDEGFHETQSDKEPLLKENMKQPKRVQFRSTVIEIGRHLDPRRAYSSLSRKNEKTDHQDVKKRKVTGRESRLSRRSQTDSSYARSRRDKKKNKSRENRRYIT